MVRKKSRLSLSETNVRFPVLHFPAFPVKREQCTIVRGNRLRGGATADCVGAYCLITGFKCRYIMSLVTKLFSIKQNEEAIIMIYKDNI